MRKITPIGELNIDQIESNVKNIKYEILEETVKDNLEELNKKSLYDIANNLVGLSYEPYLFKFSYILDRLSSDLYQDKNVESVQIKEDIIEQLKNMKKVEDFNIICHIESKNITYSSSLIHIIRKLIIRPRKYRLVFHNENIGVEKKFYKKSIKEFLYLFLMIAIYFVIGCAILNATIIITSFVFFILSFVIFLIFLIG